MGVTPRRKKVTRRAIAVLVGAVLLGTSACLHATWKRAGVDRRINELGGDVRRGAYYWVPVHQPIFLDWSTNCSDLPDYRRPLTDGAILRAHELFESTGDYPVMLLASGATLSAEGFRRLDSFPGLIALDLSFTGFRDDDVSVLGRLDRLRIVSLRGTRIMDQSAGQIAGTGISTIDISSTHITAQGLSTLMRSSSIKTITARNVRLAEAALRELKRSRPEVRLVTD